MIGANRFRCSALVGALALCLFPSAPSLAGLARSDLDRVGVFPPDDARAPLDIGVVEAHEGRVTSLGDVLGGRPTLLLFVDFNCRNLCDPMASMLMGAAGATGLPAESFNLAFAGLDPRADPGDARSLMSRLGIERTSSRPWVLTIPDAPLARLTQALGYTALYDPGTESFAHPAVALLLAPDGRLARALSPLALTGGDLRLALVEAGEGRIGGIRDQLALLCYGYDAARGLYTPLVRRMLMGGGGLVVLALALFVVTLHRRSRA